MVDFLVKRDFTPADVKKARLEGSEYRKKRATSGASNLLNMTDLKKSVFLCDSHARAFHGKHGYRPHPEHPRVIGRCDVCQMFGPAIFYLSEAEWLEAMKAKEKFRAAREYGSIVSG